MPASLARVEEKRACSLGLPSALVAATLCVVRGKQGVKVASWALQHVSLHLWLSGNDKEFWIKLLAAFRDRRNKLGLSRTDVCHNEGRLASQSGQNPLEALSKSAEARERFRRCVELLQPLFIRMATQRSQLTNADILTVRTATRGRLPLHLDAKAKAGCRFAAKYNSMAACRGIRRLLMSVHDRKKQEAPSKKLIEMMCEDQQGDDMWYLRSHGAITSFMEAHDMDWDEVLVHCCESRQVVGKFGWSGTKRILDAFDQSGDADRHAFKATAQSLFEIGFVQSCFAVKMCDEVNRRLCLGVKPVRNVEKPASVTRQAARSILVRLKNTKLSPKANIGRIPEVWALKEAFADLQTCCARFELNPSLDSLRTCARERGLQVAKSGQGKEDLVQMLKTCGTKRRLGRKASLEELRKLVSAAGKNPRPLNRAGKKNSWRAPECREWLLAQFPAAKVRRIAAIALTIVPTTKAQQISALTTLPLPAKVLQ